jgi:hypothetical protein
MPSIVHLLILTASASREPAVPMTVDPITTHSNFEFDLEWGVVLACVLFIGFSLLVFRSILEYRLNAAYKMVNQKLSSLQLSEKDSMLKRISEMEENIATTLSSKNPGS